MRLECTVNGRAVATEIEPGEPLLVTLRALGWKSVKDGCAAGDCGSCAVLLDGRAVDACLVFAAKAQGAAITTVEGLSGNGLHPLQAALVDAGAVQCGFCTPGMVMTAAELLALNPRPSPADIGEALAGNLCRCTGYVKLVAGILDAAEMMGGGDDG